jgi:hypothetical protein
MAGGVAEANIGMEAVVQKKSAVRKPTVPKLLERNGRRKILTPT